VKFSLCNSHTSSYTFNTDRWNHHSDKCKPAFVVNNTDLDAHASKSEIRPSSSSPPPPPPRVNTNIIVRIRYDIIAPRGRVVYERIRLMVDRARQRPKTARSTDETTVVVGRTRYAPHATRGVCFRRPAERRTRLWHDVITT